MPVRSKRCAERKKTKKNCDCSTHRSGVFGIEVQSLQAVPHGQDMDESVFASPGLIIGLVSPPAGQAAVRAGGLVGANLGVEGNVEVDKETPRKRALSFGVSSGILPGLRGFLCVGAHPVMF